MNTWTLNKIIFVRRGKCERDKPKRTEIHDVALELVLDLCLSSQERSPVRGISGAAFIDRDGFSILNVPDVAMEPDVRPIFYDLLVECLEIGDSFVLVVQFSSSLPHLSHVLRVLPLLRLQLDDLADPKVGENAVISNGLHDLVDAALESTHPANPNVVLGCAAAVLVIDGGVLAQDVAITDAVNLAAGIAVLVFVLVKPERKTALGILLLHVFGRKRNAEKSSEEATDMVSGVSGTDMAHKGGACQPLRNRLAPFHNSTLDSVVQQEGKDLLGDIVGGIGGGRTRTDADPDDDRTETPLRLLSQRSVSEKAGRVDRRPVDLVGLDQVADLGTNSVPDTIQRGVEDSAERLDGEMGVSADGPGEGSSEVVRAVNEDRVVAVPSDAVIIGRPLVHVGAVLGDSGGIAGEGEGGEMRRHELVAQGWGAEQAGWAGALALPTLEVDALENEQGGFWTEGGKCGIDAERS